jgi:hypothetical protein
VDIRNKYGQAKCYNKKLQYLFVKAFLQQPETNNNDPHQVREKYAKDQKNSQPFKKVGSHPVKRKGKKSVD